jgi:hypothetical protein
MTVTEWNQALVHGTVLLQLLYDIKNCMLYIMNTMYHKTLPKHARSGTKPHMHKCCPCIDVYRTWSVLSRTNTEGPTGQTMRIVSHFKYADTSPTLTDCLWFLRTTLGVVRGTQRIPNCTRWFLLSDWRVASVLGLDVTGACDVSVTRPSPCARLPQQLTW